MVEPAEPGARKDLLCPPPQRASSSGAGVQGGLVAGMVGGAALLAYVSLAAAVAGYDPWFSLKVAGAPWITGRVLLPGFDTLAVALGLASHFATAAAWGMLFGAFFYGATPGSTIALGALWGMLVWLAMFYVVLPLFGVGQLATLLPAGAAAFQHLLFGLAVAAAFLPFQRVRRSPRMPAWTRALRIG